ncbi:MAG: Omp28 family outer membrane lipoprotein [Bacteroidota bacterium]
MIFFRNRIILQCIFLTLRSKGKNIADKIVRKTQILFPGIIPFLFLIISCDKIDPPYTTESLNQDTGQVEVVRNILLEEFTGHQCPNCPEGISTSQTLKDFYGDQLIIVSIHAGFFARPTGSTFEYDFRTGEGEELNAYFGVDRNPMGLVNRKQYDGSLLLGHTAWGSAITEFTGNDPLFRINITYQESGSDQHSDIDVMVTALQSLDQVYHLVVLVTEDKIVKPQKTNNPNIEDGVIMDFEHNHVLRKSLTNIWGDALNESSIEANEQFTESYSISLEEEWVRANCHIVAYILDSETLEVMQAIEAPLQE